MGSGRACGVEALLRWRDPVRGIIGPAEFIPVAEESGMIQTLGARVLRAVTHLDVPREDAERAAAVLARLV